MTMHEPADAPYWDGLASGELRLPRCSGCQSWRWPAGHRCGGCGANGLDWAQHPMAATVYSWTRTWHRFGFTQSLDLPYISVVAQLTGSGVRLMGRMDDPDIVDPYIGQSLIGRIGTTILADRALPTIIWSRTA
ncbi:MAG: Zn-ribbon domain-containing OB-fold protein [Sphingopyxis sp.]